MAAKLITEKRVQKLNEITDVDVDFVSLVRHGANRQAFRVVKNEEGTPGREGIQTVVAPADLDLQTFAKADGNEWLQDLRTDYSLARGDFVEYEQHPRDLFHESTLKMKSYGDLLVTSGTLKAAAKADLVEMPDKVPANVVVETNTVETNKSFGDLFFEELDNFVQTSMGLMRQRGLKSAARRSGIMAAHKALGKTLGDALSVVEANEPKETKKAEDYVADKRREYEDTLEKSEDTEMFESKDEVVKLIRDTMAEEAKKAEADQAKKAEEKAAFDAAVKDAVAAELDKLKASVNKSEDDESGEQTTETEGQAPEADLAEQVKTLKSELETLKNSTSGSRANKSDAGNGTDDEETKRSVWHGTLFNWDRIQKSLEKEA